MRWSAILFLLLLASGVMLQAQDCGQDENWCAMARRHNLSCTSGADQGVYTPCSTTAATEWHFNEDWWCLSCPYTFYVVVECGTQMHLPFYDMEGVVLEFANVLTEEAPRPRVEAVNQCARDPFHYCDNRQAGPGSSS